MEGEDLREIGAYAVVVKPIEVKTFAVGMSHPRRGQDVCGGRGGPQRDQGVCGEGEEPQGGQGVTRWFGGSRFGRRGSRDCLEGEERAGSTEK